MSHVIIQSLLTSFRLYRPSVHTGDKTSRIRQLVAVEVVTEVARVQLGRLCRIRQNRPCRIRLCRQCVPSLML